MEDRLGKRVEAEIRESKTYLVEIQNLTYQDTSQFELQVHIGRRVDNAQIISPMKSKIIQLVVGGMEHMIICYFCSC